MSVRTELDGLKGMVKHFKEGLSELGNIVNAMEELYDHLESDWDALGIMERKISKLRSLLSDNEDMLPTIHHIMEQLQSERQRYIDSLQQLNSCSILDKTSNRGFVKVFEACAGHEEKVMLKTLLHNRYLRNASRRDLDTLIQNLHDNLEDARKQQNKSSMDSWNNTAQYADSDDDVLLVADNSSLKKTNIVSNNNTSGIHDKIEESDEYISSIHFKKDGGRNGSQSILEKLRGRSKKASSPSASIDMGAINELHRSMNEKEFKTLMAEQNIPLNNDFLTTGKSSSSSATTRGVSSSSSSSHNNSKKNQQQMKLTYKNTHQSAHNQRAEGVESLLVMSDDSDGDAEFDVRKVGKSPVAADDDDDDIDVEALVDTPEKRRGSSRTLKRPRRHSAKKAMQSFRDTSDSEYIDFPVKRKRRGSISDQSSTSFEEFDEEEEEEESDGIDDGSVENKAKRGSKGNYGWLDADEEKSKSRKPPQKRQQSSTEKRTPAKRGKKPSPASSASTKMGTSSSSKGLFSDFKRTNADSKSPKVTTSIVNSSRFNQGQHADAIHIDDDSAPDEDENGNDIMDKTHVPTQSASSSAKKTVQVSQRGLKRPIEEDILSQETADQVSPIPPKSSAKTSAAAAAITDTSSTMHDPATTASGARALIGGKRSSGKSPSAEPANNLSQHTLGSDDEDDTARGQQVYDWSDTTAAQIEEIRAKRREEYLRKQQQQRESETQQQNDHDGSNYWQETHVPPAVAASSASKPSREVKGLSTFAPIDLTAG